MREPFAPNLAELPPLDEEEYRLVLKPVCAADWQGKTIPPREWVWKPWLPRNAVTGLTGPPGAAKSTLSQQLCTHLAAGRAFLGTDMPLGTGLYVTCEDDMDELQRRQVKINAALNIEMQDVPDLHLDSWVGEDAQLVNVLNGIFVRTPRFQALDELIGDLKTDLVVLDLLADLWNGNESDRQAVNGFVKSHLAYLSRRHNAALLGLYHPSLAGMAAGTGTSGSTAWEGSFRSRLYLDRPDTDTDTRTLKRMKANYADLGEHQLVWVNGYLKPAGDCKQTELEKRSEKYAAAFLECLQACEGRSKAVSPTNSAANYFGKVFPKTWMMIDGRHSRITQKQFEDAYLKVEFDGAVEVISASKKAGKRLKFVGYKRP